MKQAIIFDLDGTLLDTIEDIHKAVNTALTSFGFNTIHITETTLNIGHGAYNLIRQILIKEDLDIVKNVYDAYQKYYDEHVIIHTKPYDGIDLIFEYLMNKGIKVGIVSNKHAYLVEKLVQHFFPFISHYKGMKPLIKIKPDPEMLLHMIHEMELSNEDVFYVGDSEADILCGQNANVDVIAVSYGYRSQNVLSALKPKVLLDSVDALYTYLKENI
jgi:phosphoglycolate phosphatase